MALGIPKTGIGFVLLLSLLASLCGIAAAQGNDHSADDGQQAARAWEALIRAKGGREKLQSIRNYVMTRPLETALEVFPCSHWLFGYHIDLSKRLEVYDNDKKQLTLAGVHGTEKVLNENWETGEGCWYDQVPLFLETKWYRPIPLRVTREKVDKKISDVLEVRIGDLNLAYVYEPEEMLVREVRFISGGVMLQKYRFDKYVDVDGIKMPSLWGIGISASKFAEINNLTPVTFEFNVAYDPKIFKPPFVATTPDAWKINR